MPKSKTHQKRKLKQRKKHQKFEKGINKRVEAFNALPEPEKIAILTRWKERLKKSEQPASQLGGVSFPVGEESSE